MLHPAVGPLLPAGQLTTAAPSIMAARLPAGPGRRGGELEALFLLLLWFAAVDGAASPEPPPKCEELRLGQYPERGRGALLWRWAGAARCEGRTGAGSEQPPGLEPLRKGWEGAVCRATLLSGAVVVCGRERGCSVCFSRKKSYWMRDP